MSVPGFAVGLCDDAAVFPPGSMPLPQAVPAHLRHKASPHAALVGSFVVAAPALDALAGLLDGGEVIDLSVTVPAGPEPVTGVLAQVDALPVRLAGIEVAVPEGMPAATLFEALERTAVPEQVPVLVEVPRDDRRPDIIAALPATPYRAKFRTGGVKAELHPGEAELAEAIKAVVDAGVPFKATAGLHHAIRNTDPGAGFEQHGFLNLLLATDAALGGADEAELAAILARRDGSAIATAIAGLDDRKVKAARAHFLSFGTCSITDPLNDLAALGLGVGAPEGESA